MKRLVIFSIFLAVRIQGVMAQCAMCKAGAQQSLENGAQEANWLNFGILFMMTVPYLIMLFLFFRWKRNKNNNKTHQIIN